MKKIIFSILFASSAFCALPPLYQSSKEIKKILNNPMLQEKLKRVDPIEKIEKIEKGWLITTPKQTIKVNVCYIPSERLGPAEFIIEFQNPKKR